MPVEIDHPVDDNKLGGENSDFKYLSDKKKLLSVCLPDFLTYSRETWFLFSYAEVEGLIRLIGASDEINRVSKFSFILRQAKCSTTNIFCAMIFLRFIYKKIQIEFLFFMICVGSM